MDETCYFGIERSLVKEQNVKNVKNAKVQTHISTVSVPVDKAEDMVRIQRTDNVPKILNSTIRHQSSINIPTALWSMNNRKILLNGLGRDEINDTDE